MNYYGIALSDSYLSHHGVKGQKWGVRRYQNEDGSLNAKGKKRYSRMSDDQLQKTLSKQVRQKRAEQYGWLYQYSNEAIGKHSKKAAKEYWDAYNNHKNSKEYKDAERKSIKLSEKYENGDIDDQTFFKEYSKLKPILNSDKFNNSTTYTSDGKKYSQEYLNTYGKNMTIGRLRDLGYDYDTAVQFTDRIMRAKTKTI